MYKQIGKNLCKMMVAFPIAIYWVLPHLFTEKTDTDVRFTNWQDMGNDCGRWK